MARGADANSSQDPLMPCSRAYFVNSAVLWIPNLRITFDLWNATVFLEILRIAAISLMGCPSATSCTTSRWRSVSSPEASPDPSGQPGNSSEMSFLIRGVM